jgi:5-methylcytosine-specific restriction enzyme subunit McrC
MPKTLVQVREYGVVAEGIIHSDDSPDFREVDQATFQSLLGFIEDRSSNHEFEQAFNVYRKSGRRYIRVKSFVGIVEVPTGVTLEILPKIFGGVGELDALECKRVFLRMLRSLHDAPFLRVGAAQLEVLDNYPILEFFIQNFIIELTHLVSKGLKNEYITKEENASFAKGKLMVGENIKYNFASRHRLFCSFDEFSSNTPLNRILKSTLRLLNRWTRSSSNKRQLFRLFQHFDGAEFSSNFSVDILKCESLRSSAAFSRIIEWSRVFLLGNSFGNFSGGTANFSMLFSMEKLFEDYICYLITKHCSGVSIRAQDRRFTLVRQKSHALDENYTVGLFNLRPDIVVQDNVVILDTKWKLLNESVRRFNVSEADVYQMHAYGRRYQQSRIDGTAPRLGLIYPANPNFKNKLLQMRFGEDMFLDVIPFDLSSASPAKEIREAISFFLGIKAPSASEFCA